jgi:crotonobetainyl-CoA:carnitine CoA-transferase CaiB-like acyl-CoA transferase
MVPEVGHPVAGTVKTIGAPVKFHSTPGGVKRPAPVLGQHTAEVLREAGLSADEIAAITGD